MSAHKKAHSDHHEEKRSHKDIWKKDEEEPKKPSKTSEYAKWVVRTLGLLLVLVAILGAVSMYQVNNAQLAVNVINLRSPTLETVQRSSLVSLTDDTIARVRNPAVTEQWDGLLTCLDAGCEDSKYFGMLFTMAVEGELPNPQLVHDIIVTQRYWGTGENILVFSKAMTDVNAGVARLGSVKVKKGWDSVVACDGTCAEKNDLFFSLLKEVVKVQR